MEGSYQKSTTEPNELVSTFHDRLVLISVSENGVAVFQSATYDSSRLT
jgi:hypothetical protein